MALKHVIKIPNNTTLATKNKCSINQMVQDYLDKQLIKTNYHSIT